MNETQQVNEYLWRFGYPWAPGVRDIRDLTQGLETIDSPAGTVCPNEVIDLKPGDAVRDLMVQRLHEMMAADYRSLGVQILGRTPVADGKDGPVTQALIQLPRCGLPDFTGTPAAIGQGPWKGCHGVGQFHSCHVRFTDSPPSHLTQRHSDKRTVFQECLARVREAENEIGVLFYFSGPGTGDEFQPPGGASVQTNSSFVSSSSGWIGLAIVGSDSMTCSSQAIWARFLATFGRNYSLDDLVLFWTLLLMHEWGHNKGLGHTPGGIMNPSIHRTEPRWFGVGDPAEPWMRAKFGGVAIPDDRPKPDPPDDDRSFFERLLDFIRSLFGK